MKKVLLITAITLLVFHMVVLATAIDIGLEPVEGDNQGYANWTVVSQHNPANETGTIISVEIWAKVNLVGCKVGIFYVVSGNNLTCRDYQTIGNVTAGSKQTFEVNLDVEMGDYIGITYTSGTMSSGNPDRWYVSGDQMTCVDKTFSTASSGAPHLYGTGTTAEEEENAIFFGINF